MTKPIYSMTGFGKGEASDEQYNLVVEIKSVNNRFKDFRFRMGSIFSDEEINLRRKLEENFIRGSFDIAINYKKISIDGRVDELDFEKIKSFILQMKEVTTATKTDLTIKPTDFLRSEFSKDDNESKKDELKTLLNQAMSLAINDLKKSRQVEGKKLKEVIISHRNDYERIYSNIEQYASSYETAIKDKLIKRFEENKDVIKVDESRFLQEVIFYLEKLDIHEEINRVLIHLQKFDEMMQSGGELGRSLDFLLQELNRETNTMGSKSGMKEISEAVVQMKIHLEKIREQALNIE